MQNITILKISILFGYNLNEELNGIRDSVGIIDPAGIKGSAGIKKDGRPEAERKAWMEYGYYFKAE